MTSEPPSTVHAASPARIKRLDEAVVNRIAAGEIIHRPANALKELLENALDAGATTVQINVKDGGLKVLQIQDNGSGIAKDDLDIVCERFTTSKLRSFDDLSSISTYGFRGEALASISHVAHLTITTKTRDSNCAYRAIYGDGHLIPPKPGASSAPKPCAGNTGTQITVEDLFYNVPTRKKAFKSPSEEYNRVLDVVGRYAIQNAGVGFTCRKIGSSSPDIHTTTSASTLDNIRQIYGSSVASELLEVKEENSDLQFKLSGWISNANYSVKKMNFLLFINQRLVESIPLKKAVESIYATYLPKGSHPFLYLSLLLPPENLDVNVHPTKRNVVFLDEEELVAEIGGIIEKALAGANSSRSFWVQSVLSTSAAGVSWSKEGATGNNSAAPKDTIEVDDGEDGEEDTERGIKRKGSDGKNGGATLKFTKSGDSSTARSNSANRPYENRLVRTDSRTQTLDKYYTPMTSTTSRASSESLQTRNMTDESRQEENISREKKDSTDTSKTQTTRPMDHASSASGVSDEFIMEQDILDDRTRSKKSARKRTKRVQVQLKSITELKKEAERGAHDGLTALFAGHTFVGCVNDRLALVQHGTKLYQIDYEMVSEEYFYHVALSEICNFGKFVFDPPLPMRELLLGALETEAADWERLRPSQEITEAIVEALISRKEMMHEYFSVDISDDGELVALPMMLDDYVPNMDKIPILLLRLGSEVEWTKEAPCLRDISRELAIFYAAESPLPMTRDTSNAAAATSTGMPNENRPIRPPDETNITSNEHALLDDDNDDMDLIMPSLPSPTQDPHNDENDHTDEVEAEELITADVPSDSIPETPSEHKEDSREMKDYLWAIEHRLFPAIKSAALAALTAKSRSKTNENKTAKNECRTKPGMTADGGNRSPQFWPSKALIEQGCVVQVADLPDLYKVFERC